MGRSRATDNAALVIAAADVFEAKGYRNATIDDIALAAGVSRPTVYKYTPSKVALLDSMVDAICADLQGRLDAVLAPGDAPADRLRRFIDLHVDAATKMHSFYAIVFSEQSELSPRARTRFREFARRAAADFQRLLDECVADLGPAAPAIDTWIASNLVLSMLTTLYRWYDPSGPVAPARIGAEILALIGAVVPPGRDPRVAPGPD